MQVQHRRFKIGAQMQFQAQEPKLVASMQGNMLMARNPKFGFRIRKKT